MRRDLELAGVFLAWEDGCDGQDLFDGGLGVM